MPNLPDLAWRALKGFFEDRCSQKAAAISYYGLLSLFPLVIFTVSIIGILFPHSSLRETVVDTILNNIPLGQEHNTNDLGEALRDVSGGQTDAFGLVGALALLWGASSMFGMVRSAFNDIFGIQEEPSALLRKLLDLGIVLSITPFFIASFALTASLKYASTHSDVSIPIVGGIARTSSFTGPFLGIALPLLLTYVAILAIYWLVPAGKLPLRDIVPAAFIAAVLFELVKAVFSAYVTSFTNYAVVFGPLSTIIAFLVWVYFSANVVLLGAEVAAALPRARMPRLPQTNQPPLWLAALRGVRDLLLKPGRPGAAAARRRESGETPPPV